MSSKQHKKQVERARAKRSASKYDRRTARNRIIIFVMAGLMALSLIAIPLTSLIASRADDGPVTPSDDPIDAEPQATEGPCGETPDDVPTVASQMYEAPFDLTIDPELVYVATLATTCGNIVIELDAANAPLTVNNFVNLAEDGYYEGVLFHRVVEDFVVQAGDPAGTGCGQEDCTVEGFDPDEPAFPGYSFDDELDVAQQLYDAVRAEQRALLQEDDAFADEDFDEFPIPSGYPRGTVAMANSGPDSNGSQFFVAQRDPTLRPGPDFNVLGTVIEGMPVVDDIAASPTDELGRPFAEVVILEVRIETR